MNKTVLITGSSSGIGKATSLLFQKKGWNVVATMRNPQKERDLKDSEYLKKIRLDVTDIDSIKEAVRESVDIFGRIDVLVNNAAYSLTGPFEGATPEQIRSLYDVDVFGVMNVTREIIPHFRKMKQGKIINVSSLGGVIGMPLSSFYASAKFAVEGFSESVRFELGKLGIKVKVIEPGAVNTNFASNAIIVRKRDVPSYEATLEKRLKAYGQRSNRLNDPGIIAEVIYGAAHDDNNRFRYLAGTDARLFWSIKRVLPFGVFSRLIQRVSG